MLFKKQFTPYQDIKKDLRTGDVLLMHGLLWTSRVIQSITRSYWSHAAIVVLAKDIYPYVDPAINADMDDILLWEADTKTNVEDVILKKTKSGPMLVKLSERLTNNIQNKESANIIAVRHLYTDRTPEMFRQIAKVITDVHNVEFPSGLYEFIDPLKGRFFKKSTSLDSFFCSELVAYTYMKMGLLTEAHPVNSYLPLDFSNKLTVSLLKRAQLGSEIRLKV